MRADISDSLCCLPIFVQGCKNMAVLAGPTYYERLWCILEVYLFVQLGGKEEAIIVMPLSDAQTLHSILDRFSVRTARATKTSDRECMLAVIESSFGSLAAFDATIQNILRHRHGDGTRRWPTYHEPLLADPIPLSPAH